MATRWLNLEVDVMARSWYFSKAPAIKVLLKKGMPDRCKIAFYTKSLWRLL